MIAVLVAVVVAVAVAVAIAVGALVATVRYRRQIVSYLTHWKGSPAHTVAYAPYEPSPAVHLAAVGDVGDSGARIAGIGAAMARLGRDDPYDALVLLGDNVYPSGDPAQLPGTVFQPFADVLGQGTELLAIVGNHDAKHGNARPQMRALGMENLWWSRSIGDLLIVGVDSNDPRNAEQLHFLRDTLSTSDARWRIVALHHPPYSAGYQGSSKRVRAVFSPIFAEHGVQLVLSGHDHDYQRSRPIDGVTYIVSGAAANRRRTGSARFTAESFAWHHFLDIAVFADRLVVRAVNKDGRVADEARLA